MNNHLELPTNISNYDENTQKLIIEYLNCLSDIEMKAYKIAKSHLGSSFNLVKSNGFCEWKEQHIYNGKYYADLTEMEAQINEDNKLKSCK